MGRSRKKRDPEKEAAHYLIEINDWRLSYSFSLNDNERLKDIFGPSLYREYSCLVLSGLLLKPKKVAGKDLEMKIYGSREMVEVLNDPDKFLNATAKAIGGLTVRGKTREYYGSIPQDNFGVIANMLAAGKIKYITMFGHALYRGYADIHSIDFEQDYYADDW